MKTCLLATLLMISVCQTVVAQSFSDLREALEVPEKTTSLSLFTANASIKHLPPELGNLVNLVELSIACLENLEDLPKEISNLKKLKILNLDNGTGCEMNVALPETIGTLQELEVLNLFGALDPNSHERKKVDVESKALPVGIRHLTHLQELNLGRNSISSIPPQIKELHKLKKLALDYNDIHEVPEFVADLKNLQELSLCNNGGVKLPASLTKIKGLTIYMGNNRLSREDQEKLRESFPMTKFNFENDVDDAYANEERPE